jgi:DNA repair exonuclease SbcCD ATPase subunit
MRIIGFKADKVLRLDTVEIKPKTDVVVLAGKNRQGKSSVLKSIWMALAGEGAVPDEPIHRGSKKGKVRLELGKGETVELIVERSFTEKGSYLRFEDPKTGFGGSQQKFLDKLLGARSFDPMQFMGMDAKKQGETIRRLTGLDFTKLLEKRKALFDERTAVKKDHTTAEAQIADIKIPEDAPAEPVDVSEILAKRREAEAKNSERNAAANTLITLTADKARAEQDREYRQGLITTYTEEVEQRRAALAVEQEPARADTAALQQRIAELQAELAAAEATNARHAEWQARQADAQDTIKSYEDSIERVGQEIAELDTVVETKAMTMAELEKQMPEAVDLAQFDQSIEQAGRLNALHEQAKERRKLKASREAELKTLAEKAKALSAQIEVIDAEKAKQLAEAKMPIEGLTIDDEGELRFQGTLLEQVSTAEGMLISLSIGAALNPTLRAIRIENGALLDDDSRAIVERYAAEHDLQVWLEVIDPEDGAIVIVDGMVEGVEPAADSEEEKPSDAGEKIDTGGEVISDKQAQSDLPI